MKILAQQDSKKEVSYKSFEAKEDIAQIENIPDNTQVLSSKVTEDVKDVVLDIKIEINGRHWMLNEECVMTAKSFSALDR